MAIIRCDFPQSEELAKELNSLDLSPQDFNSLTQYPTPDSFLDSWPAPHHRIEAENIAQSLPSPCTVLDIGVGSGHTSILLALLGHKVTCVEPSLFFCNVLEKLAEKFSLNLTIYQTIGEYLPMEGGYDICLFNASLHHCDHPVLALKNCHALLKPNGKVFLINEPVLKFYRTQKWYQKMRETNPEAVGDYGGNEHIYRCHEYGAMLKEAGFSTIREQVPLNYFRPRENLQSALNAKMGENFVYPDKIILLKTIWYFSLSRLLKNPFFVIIAKKLSLIAPTFVGVKSHS